MHRGEDEERMRECIALAKKGAGAVSPNPLVGALIVRNGKVLGKGFHEKYGGHHAEINAIRDALRRHASIQGATLYVNLEPCVHHGKTPPCVDAIVSHGIKKVVASMQDPNPQVAGKGFRSLRRSGVSVVTGILKSEGELLNEKFSWFITAGKPFVTIKAAQTADGFIARRDGSSRWISSKESRTLVHRLRSEYDAVLVGAGTAIADDPHLTVRHVKGRNPVRVLIDGKLRTPLTARLFNDKYRGQTIVFTGRSNAKRISDLRRRGIHVIVVLGRNNGVIPADTILRELAKKGIASVLVEGGQTIFSQFVNTRSVQKIFLFTSPKKFNHGLPLFKNIHKGFRIVRKTEKRIGRDRCVEGYFSYRRGN